MCALAFGKSLMQGIPYYMNIKWYIHQRDLGSYNVNLALINIAGKFF